MKRFNNYWTFQALGWTALLGFNFVILSTVNKLQGTFIISMLIFAIMGLALTHLMRFTILKLDVLSNPLPRQIGLLLTITIVFAFTLGLSSELLDRYFLKINDGMSQKYTSGQRIFLSFVNAFWILLLWNMIYFFYHVIENARKQELDKLRLTAEVKNMELKTIKAHINPHFIFNALNSIRALIDEDPQLARKGITQLSNILRSSLNAQNLETVTLKEELDIVKDYLSLEKVRFEERLHIYMDIDPETLDRKIPPMMLQTLVENAIKHGISKRLEGGFVRISSHVVNGKHELKVTNSGKLEKSIHNSGFGIRSTEDRLNILYHGNAHFEIASPYENEVESRVSIPA